MKFNQYVLKENLIFFSNILSNILEFSKFNVNILPKLFELLKFFFAENHDNKEYISLILLIVFLMNLLFGMGFVLGIFCKLNVLNLNRIKIPESLTQLMKNLQNFTIFNSFFTMNILCKGLYFVYGTTATTNSKIIAVKFQCIVIGMPRFIFINPYLFNKNSLEIYKIYTVYSFQQMCDITSRTCEFSKFTHIYIFLW